MSDERPCTPTGSCHRRPAERGGSCGREVCRKVSNRYLKQQRLRRASGDGARVPSGPVVEHVRWLREQVPGVGYRTIAHAAGGIAETTIIHLTRGTYPTVARYVADAVMAVTPADLLPYRVAACGAVRRIQALARIGWPVEQQGELVGRSRTYVEKVLQRGVHGLINHATDVAVRDLYERLSMTPGPSTQTIGRAIRRGWAPPLAWDEDTIDDPTATPSGAVGIPTSRHPVINVDDVVWLAESGLTMENVARRLGVYTASVERALLRVRRQDVIARLRANGYTPGHHGRYEVVAS